ncbi:hypothetical protein [Nostoc sp. MS1]|uniref:hypothetical protein n=1 Tax=Nostoc sp. MS1 TaxID=2764711 RepID=UPI001CC6D4E5|nr:hypothetical protein [Nostoc sp. MS1]BCL40297.1 hypothetical protein NSMS1_67440 [Nostoc sp. MS1]
MLNLYKDTVKENLISNLAAAIVDNIQRYGDIKQLCTNILAFRDIDNDERKTIYKVVWSNYSNKPIEDFLQEHDLSYLLYAIGEEYKDVNYENYIKSMFLFFITRKEEFLYFINPNKIIDETIFLIVY